MGTSEIGPFSGGNTAIFQRVDGSQLSFDSTGATMSFNTEQQAKPWVSLSSDEFTLDPGVYAIEVRISVKNLQASNNTLQIYAYDTGGAATIGAEIDEFIANEVRKSIAKFILNISSQTTLEIRGISKALTFNPTPGETTPSFNSQVYFTKIG